VNQPVGLHNETSNPALEFDECAGRMLHAGRPMYKGIYFWDVSTTPIFDLEQDLPKPRSRPRNVWRSYALLGSVGLLFSYWAPPPSRDGLTYLLPALYLGLMTHELAHAVTGKLAGLDVGGLCIGGFMLVRSGDRWMFRFSLRWLLNVGGFVVPLPASREVPQSRFAWFVAGGPIASILLTTVCWLAVHRSGDEAGDWSRTLLWASVVFIVASVTPYSVQGMKSDGLVLWRLWRKPEFTRRLMNFLALRAAEIKGVRPRDWDGKLMREALDTTETEAFYTSVQLYAWYWRVDEGDETGALEYLEKFLASAGHGRSKALKRSACQVAAAASASTRNNPAQARVWMERVRKFGRPTAAESTEGIEAQIAMIEGRYEDALAHWTAMRVHLNRRHGDSGIIRYLRDRIETGETECRAAINGKSRTAVGTQN
jgi:hypothetical protein